MRTTYLAAWVGLLALCLPVPVQANWYKGQTHVHTLNSDGNATPAEAARWYREHGYQFVFITDHEYISDVEPLNALLGAEERFLVLPGQEITQWSEDPNRRGPHVNALFVKNIIWPVGQRRCTGGGCGAVADKSISTAETYRRNIAAILTQGAVAQVNHPNGWWTTRPEDLFAIPDNSLLEIWNASGANNLGGTDNEGHESPSGEGFWDILLTRGQKIWGVGSDDAHDYRPEGATEPGAPGRAWIMVRADQLTAEAVKTALKQGDFYASTGIGLADIVAADGVLTLKVELPKGQARRYLTRFIGKGGVMLASVAGVEPSYRFRGDEGYVRAVVTDSDGLQAWSQPVFLPTSAGKKP